MSSQTGRHEQGDTGATASPVVFGEVLFDCFPDGRRVLGGAPFNVAWGLKGFGLDPVLVSAVGDDEDGRTIRSKMESWGMRTEGLATHPSLTTGTVDVHLENGDAKYEIPKPRAWDEITAGTFSTSSMIYHGMLALRSDFNGETLKALVEHSSAERFFDVNLRPPHTPLERVKEWLPGTTWVKCNIDELQDLLKLPTLDFAGCADAANRLREVYDIANVLVTAGGDGACAVGDFGEERFTPPAPDRELVDTVGAGDSFTAVFMHGLITGRPIAETLRAAGKFARTVCYMRGATTDNPSFYSLT